MSITEIAIKRPSLIIVFFAILVIGGLYSYGLLNIEFMPDFSRPMITVTTLYPGAAPTEVESSVTQKIEDEVSGLENITEVSSKSFENASLIMITFKHGTNLDLMMQDVQRKIDNIKKDLPDEVLAPTLSKVSPSDLPIMYIAANSNMSGRDFNTWIDDKIVPQFEQIKGLASVSMLGNEEREIKIEIDADKLKLYNLAVTQLTQAIKQANVEFPTGSIKNAQQEITVKMTTKFASLSEIENLVVFTPAQGTPIYLKDVARLSDQSKETQNLARYNGQSVLTLLIKKQKDGNAVNISHAIREKIKELEKTNAGIDLKFVVIDDTSTFTEEAVEAVTHDLYISILLVGAIMLLFLHSIRNALIVMIAIPASLISTFLFMYLLGYSLNLMTLLAMSLVIGILVDDSIVVLENIYRHMEMGKDRIKATLEGRAEIGFSALSITLVDVVVFLPIIFVNTSISDVLTQYSMVVVCSTLMSLVVCFTLTPWLVSRFGKLVHLNPKNFFQRFLLAFEVLITRFTKAYVKLVDWALSHKLATLSIKVLLFVGTGIMMQMNILGQELVAQGDRGRFMITAEFDRGTSLSQNDQVTAQMEKSILADPYVESVFTNIGGPSTGFGGTGLGLKSRTELTVQLKPKSERPEVVTESYMMDLRGRLAANFAGIKFSTTKIGLFQDAQAPVQVILSSENYEVMMAEAKRLEQMLLDIPGANDVKISAEEGNPELQVKLDKEKMALLGLNTAVVGANLQNALSGNDDSQFKNQNNEFDIRVALTDFDRKNPEDIKKLNFVNNQGAMVQLSQFGTVVQSTGASVLERKNRRSSVTVSSNALGIGSGTVAQNFAKAIEAAPLDAAVSMEWGGEIKDQNESFGALGVALLASLLLVYLIMVALYDNFVYPFVVLFSVPVALIGALLALNLTLSNISIFAGLGMIMLMGLVMKNAILIVDFTNQLKKEGMHYRAALLSAVEERMRPILMTTIAMVIGMLPIALAKGSGAEWKNALAWVLIGGLTSSMFLTIVLVPVVYYMVDRIKERLNGFFHHKASKNLPEIASDTI